MKYFYLYVSMFVALSLPIHAVAVYHLYCLINLTGWIKVFGWMIGLFVTMLIPRLVLVLWLAGFITAEGAQLVAAVIFCIDSAMAVYIAIQFRRRFIKFYEVDGNSVAEILARVQRDLAKIKAE